MNHYSEVRISPEETSQSFRLDIILLWQVSEISNVNHIFKFRMLWTILMTNNRLHGSTIAVQKMVIVWRAYAMLSSRRLEEIFSSSPIIVNCIRCNSTTSCAIFFQSVIAIQNTSSERLQNHITGFWIGFRAHVIRSLPKTEEKLTFLHGFCTMERWQLYYIRNIL